MKELVYVRAIPAMDWIKTHGPMCIDVIRKYFEGNGHEVVVDQSSHSPEEAPWQWLLCHKKYPGYDYILTWDLDILPQRKIDIFKDIDFDEFGACVEADGKSTQFPYYRYNCGMVGIPAIHDELCQKIYELWHTNPKNWPSFEQYYWNMVIGEKDIYVQPIDRKYACFPLREDGKENAVCIHYTAVVQKKSKPFDALPMMEEHCKRILEKGFAE
jgi:hypothetical protein